MLKVRNLILVIAALIQISSGLQMDPSICQESSYFDTPSYKCLPCGANAIQNVTSGQECICKPGYQKVYDTRFNFKFDC